MEKKEHKKINVLDIAYTIADFVRFILIVMIVIFLILMFVVVDFLASRFP